ncbi:tail fiber assembly protein [Escherichia sp. E1130]|uniref:tail fiber assembly protein n=1 Tax=Escherichia sp. E1130 TaxID=2041645 RepID=UPI00107FFF91|nr:tail fiber assembly protein [Escherichia sp. E1130]TGC28855.1 tail assembly chaperone [Escherichia sp. E1130]TLI70122.1 tail fiber assembly protein [Escherichia sp. E1130]
MRLNNLKRYFPDELFNGDGIQYFIDEDGKDWFKSLPTFKKDFAIAFDSNGIIRFYGSEPSRFYPVGLSVVDVDSLPEGINVLGEWVFDGKNIASRKLSKDELITKAESEKAGLMAIANVAITPLQYAVDLGEAMEEETTLLLKWKKYLIHLNRVDTSKAPNMDWPAPPKM